jgi:hypothetical protein
MLIGYFLSVTVLVSTFMVGGRGGLLQIAMPLLILGVPLYDTASVVLIRLRRRRSPFSPDLNHLAHRVHRLGLSRRQTVLFVYLLTFAVGMGALALSRCGADDEHLRHIHERLTGWVIIVQALAVFGVIMVLEWVSFGARRVTLTTPVPADLEVQLEGPLRASGVVCRLAMTGADLEVEELDARAAAEAADSGARGRLRVRFESPFEEMRVEATVRGLERIDPRGWRVSLDFAELSPKDRKNLEFALTHFRALGEG